jgi:enamine deaminase RidA (YjgF/YER057c/UK114 family)
VTRRVSSPSPFEDVVGYSRAVAAGGLVHVSGCTSMAGTELVHEGDAYGQAGQAIRNIAAALEPFGGTLADVVRTRMFVTDIDRWDEVGRAHREAFDDVRPATAMYGITRLIDPRMLVEIEADAYLPGAGDQP